MVRTLDFQRSNKFTPCMATFKARGSLLASVLAAVGASVCCGLAQTMPQLVVFRAFQGAGAGGLAGLSMALVADIAPLDEEPLSPETEPMVFINPVITPVGKDVVEDWEGCLSIPDLRGRVPRARAITVTAMDRRGEKIEIASLDFPARVIQHETDHLDGVLFLDRMRSFESLAFLEEHSRYWAKDRD